MQKSNQEIMADLQTQASEAMNTVAEAYWVGDLETSGQAMEEYDQLREEIREVEDFEFIINTLPETRFDPLERSLESDRYKHINHKLPEHTGELFVIAHSPSDKALKKYDDNWGRSREFPSTRSGQELTVEPDFGFEL